MTSKSINIEELKEYIDAAFYGDIELLSFYDPSQPVKTIEEACENVYSKIKYNYSDDQFSGIEIGGEKVGYFVYGNSILISFGINRKYREGISLSHFWGKIKEKLGDTFQCVLYSHNKRAIGWLERCGMETKVNNVSILTICQQED